MEPKVLPIPQQQSQDVNDASLAQQAAQGDKSAFEALYQRHHKRIYALALRLGGEPSLADEILQESFVRLWHKLPQFRGESQFGTWFYSLALNQALSTLKQHRSFWARMVPDWQIQDAPEHSQNDDGLLLDRLIVRLPERARLVFVLFAVEGFSHEEVASLLGISTGTSKAHYHRARELMKEMLS
ncbi:RNA polymerase sigma factor [Shewanella amazonensis]|uniref:RNA polymerase, sigma-24 subunit, ECF subfamily n=1 Tax=Shewanella amazonensis (strain ATCC BAA-1098 / SB2B) TaxID=326297 RepID=A1S8V7_SHEAM|nr:RNA polymerase sigma factor [Shewanella amazonensis]ABM00814.1 RNA polymerase, sigma-24 subunit, ECF subfamily [Shewanella amazonensis SB2B]